jgi:hypothetical protein
MAIVCPCSMSVEAYASAGREVEVPLADCPACTRPMRPWSGYWRPVRHLGTDLRIFVPRNYCRPCVATHALLPAFCLKKRLDTVEVIGVAIDAVVTGTRCGHRRAATVAGVPRTTARGWLRRFVRNAERLAVAFAALCVELGGVVPVLTGDAQRRALRSMEATYEAALGLPGWDQVGRWRFCAAVSGGTLIACNTISPYLVVGKRRFMPPVP